MEQITLGMLGYTDRNHEDIIIFSKFLRSRSFEYKPAYNHLVNTSNVNIDPNNKYWRKVVVHGKTKTYNRLIADLAQYKDDINPQ